MKVGTIQTQIGTVDLYRAEDDAPCMCHACHTPAELGLTEGHPTQLRPDHQGGFYQAAVFPLPLEYSDTAAFIRLSYRQGINPLPALRKRWGGEWKYTTTATAEDHPGAVEYRADDWSWRVFWTPAAK